VPPVSERAAIEAVGRTKRYGDVTSVENRTPRLAALAGRELPGGLRVAEAVRWNARRRGLAGLGAIGPDEGLHIRATRSVHTMGMRFALDLLWLGAAGELVRVDRAVPPRRVRTCLRARSVVEVAAGRADAFLAAGVGGRS
jgi:uncharacterized membrane protein (UPF0127 family)